MLQHGVLAWDLFRHVRVGAWYRPLLSLGEALFCRPPSLGPRVEPPCRVESGWERNALGCGAAPTVGNRRNNSNSMDSNDPYLHLSKYHLLNTQSVHCVPRGVNAFCFDLGESAFVSWRLLFSLRAVRETATGSNNRLLVVDPVLMWLCLVIILTLCQMKRKLWQMQKSGDRGCAGQARSEVGTLIALM